MTSRKFAGVLVPFLMSFSAFAGAQDRPPGDPIPPPPPDFDGGTPPSGLCFGIQPGECAPEDIGTPCGDNGACVEGVCATLGGGCGNSEDCMGQGSCFEVANECQSSEQCEEGWQCQTGICMRPLEGAPIGPFPECKPGDPACQPEPPRIECENNEQCGGFPCDEGFCAFPTDMPMPPRIECESEEQCGGFPCAEGFCAFPTDMPPPPPPPCMDGEECPEPGEPGGGDGDGEGPVAGGGSNTGNEDTDAMDDSKDEKDPAAALNCSVSGKSSTFGGLGLMLALSTLIYRRRKS